MVFKKGSGISRAVQITAVLVILLVVIYYHQTVVAKMRERAQSLAFQLNAGQITQKEYDQRIARNIYRVWFLRPVDVLSSVTETPK